MSEFAVHALDDALLTVTKAGALDLDKQLAVVSQLTQLIADAAGDPALTARTCVLLAEAIPGGWGLGGHAHTNDEIVAAARAQIAQLQTKALTDPAAPFLRSAALRLFSGGVARSQ